MQTLIRVITSLIIGGITLFLLCTLSLLVFVIGARAQSWQLVYSQENVPVIYKNVQWDGYTGQNAGHCGNTWFPTYTGNASVYPYPNFIPDSTFAPITFYGGDGDTNAIGTSGALQYQIFGLQGGSTVGVVLSPNAVSPAMDAAAVLVNYWLCTPVTPFGAGHYGVKMSIDAVFPFIYVPSAGDGSIPSQGAVFSYMVLYLQNITDPYQLLYITPRLVQSAYPTHGEGPPYTWDFNPGDQFSYDPSNNNAGEISPQLGASTLVSSCGNGHFRIGSYPYMQTYCFTMSPQQLHTAIVAMNASGHSPRQYDTTAANWKVVGINLDIEAWTGTTRNDTRIGLSERNFKLWID